MAALAFLAVIDLGQTLGVGYIGVAISSMYVHPLERNRDYFNRYNL